MKLEFKSKGNTVKISRDQDRKGVYNNQSESDLTEQAVFKSRQINSIKLLYWWCYLEGQGVHNDQTIHYREDGCW